MLKPKPPNIKLPKKKIDKGYVPSPPPPRKQEGGYVPPPPPPKEKRNT